MPSSGPAPHRPPRPGGVELRGAIPHALRGRFVVIGPDHVVHSVHVNAGGATYVASPIRAAVVLRELVAVDRTLIALDEHGVAFELDELAGTAHPVDLAGNGRVLVSCPAYDHITGELHLVAHGADGSCAHVVVPAGALTRRVRPIPDVHPPVRALALSDECLVLLADGAIGVTARDGDARTTWFATGVPAPRPIHACARGSIITLLVLTPSLERWVVQPDGRAVERERVDVSAPPDVVVAVTGGDDGATWCLRVVLDPASGAAELHLLDISAISGPAVATIRMPPGLRHPLGVAWAPSTT